MRECIGVSMLGSFLFRFTSVHHSKFIQIPATEPSDLILKQGSMHAGQNRTDFCRTAFAYDANCVTGFKLHMFSHSLSDCGSQRSTMPDIPVVPWSRSWSSKSETASTRRNILCPEHASPEESSSPMPTRRRSVPSGLARRVETILRAVCYLERTSTYFSPSC